MLVLRRLASVLAVVAVLVAAVLATAYAVDGDGTGRPSASGTGAAETRPPAPETAPQISPVAEPDPPSVTRPRARMEPGVALLEPGAEGPRVRELQARLKQIAWFTTDITAVYGELTTEAVRGFQEKREIPVTGEVDRRTLDRLLAMTAEPTPAELQDRANQPGALDPRCRIGRVLCIDKTSQTLRWVVDGTVRETVDVRFGSSTTPTREGTFSVYLKSRDHVSRLYGSAMPFAMFFSGGQAVHYSSDFAAVGYGGASHGCVNVRDYDAIAQLYDQVREGDTVVVYWS